MDDNALVSKHAESTKAENAEKGSDKGTTVVHSFSRMLSVRRKGSVDSRCPRGWTFVTVALREGSQTQKLRRVWIRFHETLGNGTCVDREKT